MNDKLKTVFKILGVILALYLFLVGIKGLSNGIKLLGGDFANQIMTTTSNPFISLLVGILATTLFQSSSTTTSLIVGLVAGGALTLSGAIPMIMGANIGTTVTNTIVSMGHIKRGNEFKRAFSAATHHDIFNVLSVLILLPLERPLIPTKKRYKAKITPAILNMIFKFLFIRLIKLLYYKLMSKYYRTIMDLLKKC